MVLFGCLVHGNGWKSRKETFGSSPIQGIIEARKDRRKHRSLEHTERIVVLGMERLVTSSSARMSRWELFVRRLKRIWPLYMIMLPGLLVTTIFAYGPMYGAIIAFKDYKIAKGIWGSNWVGLKWFKKFIDYYQFEALIVNTLRISIYNIVATMVVAILLALMIHCVRNKQVKSVLQTVMYLPHFVSIVVMVGTLIRFLNPSMGIISKLIQSLGGTSRDLMGVPSAVPHLYVWSGIWQNAGWSTILYLAALTAVDPELHEAAIVDGASRFKRVIHIDIPAIIPVIVISLIMNMGKVLTVGTDKILLMQNDLNRTTTEVITSYVYNQGIAAASPKYSYATAIGLMNSLLSFVLIVVVNQICKKVNETSLF